VQETWILFAYGTAGDGEAKEEAIVFPEEITVEDMHVE
jgi:hypothetical protein